MRLFLYFFQYTQTIKQQPGCQFIARTLLPGSCDIICSFPLCRGTVGREAFVMMGVSRFAGLDPGQVEHIVDKLEQVAGTGEDVAQVLALLGGDRSGLFVVD